MGGGTCHDLCIWVAEIILGLLILLRASVWCTRLEDNTPDTVYQVCVGDVFTCGDLWKGWSYLPHLLVVVVSEIQVICANNLILTDVAVYRKGQIFSSAFKMLWYTLTTGAAVVYLLGPIELVTEGWPA